MTAFFIYPKKGFNTQPPEGGWQIRRNRATWPSGFNTQPPEGGWQIVFRSQTRLSMFQHTAARRRLDVDENFIYGTGSVSTHSRPKAAGVG